MNGKWNSRSGIRERLMDAAGSLVDAMFLSAPKMAAPFMPVRKITRQEYERQVDFYIDSGFTDRPESFFTFPPATPSWSIIERKPYHDGEYQLLRYESGYEARNPLIRERYRSFAANRYGYIVRWTHGDRKRKTVLCHHGYMLGEPRQARKMFRVKRLFSEGLDVALFIAPFHWKRSAGPLFQRGIYLQPDDVVMTCECVGQAMHDLYGAFRILLDDGAPEVGLIGASLGGYNTALFISLSDIASFGAMMVPAVNFSRPLGPDTARLPFAVDGPFREKIRRVWELHSPLNFKPKLPAENILVVASRGDRICPFEYIRELCDRWGVTNRHFLTGGHWLIVNREERGRAWYAFLRERGFLDSTTE
jgi:predicted alpha/beta hydrolase family esterase